MEVNPLVVLAQCGLFLPHHAAPITEASKKSYSLRVATESDIERLVLIEQECWTNLSIPRDRILSRIKHHPSGQWVSVVNNEVVGVMYTQRIRSSHELSQPNITFATQESLHTAEGSSVVQLLGVAVLPGFAHLQIGAGLRDFVLQLARQDASVESVVAMTRCSSLMEAANDTIGQAYLEKARSGADPTLMFHQSGGAKIVSVVPNYRPEDTVNLGHAVLIQYDIRAPSRLTETASTTVSTEPADNTVGASENIISIGQIKTLLLETIENKAAVDAVLNMQTSDLLNTPFMDLGLQSLEMVELRARLQALCRITTLSSTLLFDFPTPRLLLAELNHGSRNHEHSADAEKLAEACAGEKNEQGVEGEHVMFAICAMSCRLPGDITSPEAFHQALLDKTHTVAPLPTAWKWDAKTQHASLLNDSLAESFDHAFFKINAVEAQQMDPHQRLLLEVGHEALVSAGALHGVTQSKQASQVGVFVGLCNNEWNHSNGDVPLGPYSTTGSAQSATANRMSFLLGLTGPSMVVDTACSSSLAALHTAMNALKCGDCDVALVAAADLLVSSHSLKIREAANMLSPDGMNKSFDNSANGYVRGEGAGAVVIKTLRRAEADLRAAALARQSDDSTAFAAPILAVIRGSAMNQDGRSATFTAPNGSAQRALLRSALRAARTPASALSYVEAHGTGTALGDPIEWGALRDVLLTGPAAPSTSAAQQPLVIGAVKSNIGHLEGAAGLAGLIKAVNCLRYRSVPANLHMEKLNSHMAIDPTHRPAVFPRVAVSLGAAGGNDVLCAGVSSFGSGGTNVHVILQSYIVTTAEDTVHAAQSFDLEDRSTKLAYVCSGQGLVYAYMGRELYEAEPAFKDVIDRCSAAVKVVPTLAEVMYGSLEVSDLINSALYSQLSLFALEVALAAVWKTRGVSPNAVVGHSLGEYAAAAIAGVFSPEVGIQLVHARLQSLQQHGAATGADGVMVAVRCSEALVVAALQTVRADPTVSGEVALAGVNGPNSVTLSGSRTAVTAVLTALGSPSSKFVTVEYAFHSALVSRAAQDFEERFNALLASGAIAFAAPTSSVSVVSCMTGKVVSALEMSSPAYWAKQMLSPVRFVDCVATLQRDLGVRTLVEVGPSNMFSKMATNCVTNTTVGDRCEHVSSLLKGTDSLDQLNLALSAVQRLVQSQALRQGGRLSPAYRPVPMKWRKRGPERPPSRGSDSPSLSRSVSRSKPSVLYDTVHAAIASVLPAEALEYLSGGTSFLSLGLDSLASQAVRNTLASQLDLPNLSNTVVLKHPSLDELVEYLQARIAAANKPGARPESRCASPKRVVEEVFDIDDLLEDGVESQFAATCMQQAMLFHHVADPDAKSFIETFRWEVTGPLDVQRFHRAWVAVIKCHSSLRSSFDPFAVPAPLQKIWQISSVPELNGSAAQASWFSVVSVPAGASEAEVDRFVDAQLKAQRAWNFELSSPLLLKVAVVNVAHSSAVVLFTVHHAAVDGVSMLHVLRTLSHFYTAPVELYNAAEFEKFAAPYHQFAEYERSLLSSRDRSAQRYWSGVVQGWQSGPHAMINMPQLKVNLPDEDVVRVFRTLDADYLLDFQDAAKTSHVTLAAFFHAAWGATYAKLTCAEDILYGNTSSGRSAHVPNILNVVGPVINTFPMRYAVESGQTIGDYLHTVQRTLVNCLEFENYPLAEIQKLAQGSGNLFSVIFDFQTTAWDHVLAAGNGPEEVKMINSRLLDRIGCPISIRVIVDNGILQLHATSECKEYGHAVLESMLNSLVHVATFMADVVSGNNPLHRDVRAKVFDLMDLVPLCRNRKLSIVTFTEDEGDTAAMPTILVPASATSEELDHVLPYMNNVSAPAHFSVLLEGEERLNFLQNCGTLGCDASVAVLSFYVWAVRRFARTSEVNMNYTSAHPSNATKHISVNIASDVALETLLTTVASVLAVDQSTLPVAVQSAVVFTCAPNPLLPHDTIAALVMHETASTINVSLKFPTAHVPSEVMAGVFEALRALIDQIASRPNVAEHLSLVTVVPLVPPVPSIREDCPISDRLMHDDFYTNAQLPRFAGLPAVVQFTSAGEQVSFSYAHLLQIADASAAKLATHVTQAKTLAKAGSTCVIAVVMEKGWEQVAAVLAVHRLQCAYLPMDARLWPEQRIRQVLELSEAVAVFTQARLLDSAELAWMKALSIPVLAVGESSDPVNTSDLASLNAIPRVTADDLAYLIYTSGSTGVPKGVCCHHRGAMNTIDDLNSMFSITQKDRVLALSSLSFDLSVYDIFGLLSAGGTVIIPNPSTVSPPDPSEWFDLVESEQVSVWNTVPAFMELLVGHAEYLGLRLPSCLRLVCMSGDWIPVTLPNRIRAVSDCADIRIISMGGATEASIWSNMFELENSGASGGVPGGWSSIPYGRPMRNQRMYVLNERMENCDVWVTGAIYIGGVGVAQGYYKNPERTEYQFSKSALNGEALFRTGDLGRVRPGGLIEILGREDSQVKVNGFRIELGEIERVLVEHEGVASAALAVHNNTLCAYLVMRDPDAPFDSAPLRELCKVRLAEYMVPHHFMCINEIPLSSNGKVQRDKLPKIEQETHIFDGSGDDQPLTEKEQTIVNIWATILGLNPASIPADANFFSLGGDSLRSVQVVALAKKFGLLISVPQIFNNPTVHALAEAANSFRELGPEILGTSSDQVNAKPIFTVDVRDDLQYEEYPLIGINQAHFVGLHTSSYAQHGMTPQIYFEWEIGQAGGHSGGPGAEDGEFGGQISVARFEEAIDLFVARHATFRSVVCKNGNMRVLRSVPHFAIEHISAWTGDAEEAARTAAEYRAVMMDNGPTVHEWPLFEVRITHTSATSSLVHINVSLFLMDAMSDLILRQELSALYRAAPITDINAVLPAPTRLQFKDYCSALTTKLQLSEEYIRAREYWLSRIDDLSSGPELPTLPQPADGSGGILTGKFVNHHRWLSVLEWKRARKNCAFHSVTMPAVLLAAYSIVLYRWGSRDRFLINILQCLRHQVHEDVNKMVGNCSSTILCDINLRAPEKGELSFRIAVQRVAQELSQNLEHASMSGVEVMQELNRIRGKTFKAVAPFIFTTPIGVEKGNKQVASRNWMFQEKFFSERVPHTACVNAIKADPNGTACASLDVVDGVFPKEVMQGMHETYCALLDIICAEDPNAWHEPLNKRLALPRPVDSIRPDCAVSGRLMHDDFMHNAQAAVLPQAPAVVQYNSSGEKLSLNYDDLHRISGNAAAKLAQSVTLAKQAAKAGSTCVIAVVMEKGWEQVAAVLAVHRLQCAYLPMDARLWPEQRIRQVLELSEAVAVFTQARLLESDTLSWMKRLPIPVVCVEVSTADRVEPADLKILESLKRVTADDLAYLIYTSGSTGVPKGVCCHHRGAMNTIDDLNSMFSVTQKDRVLALSSLSFDLSVYDIFGLLSAGGTVIMPNPDTVSPPDPSKWFDLVQAEQITLWNTVPAFMELLVSHAEYTGQRLPSCLRLVYMSGDWIPVTLPNRIRAVSDCADIRIISMGGATEASIWSNMFELENNGASGGVPEGWSSIPYGRPMRNQRMYVLNERMENCDVWVTGAIYIGGVGVAQGYYKNPERTEYQFVKHNVTGEFLFRTGDLGRVRPGGLIEILGREDSQVKVNGFRIELGEIERVLVEHEGVASAALAVHNNTLCAYLVMKSNFDKEADEVAEDTVFEVLQAACKIKLADYMVPKHFMFIDEVPLSSNGKVQREKLPSPQQLLNEARKRSNSITDRLVLPASDLEAQVRSIFARILNTQEDAICCKRGTFFDLGGNSLTSIQLIFALRDKFGVTIGVQDLFRTPTVLGVAALIAVDKSYLGDHTASEGAASGMTNGSSAAADVASIEQLQLNEGQPNVAPLILFNPAGASGLCYLQLVQQIEKSRPVYVLDDGVMTSGREFLFKSIEQVAAACLPFVTAIAAKHAQGEIVLAGWSYGGVVASMVATLLNSSADSASKHTIAVKALILFDSPLRAPRSTADSTETDSGVHTTAPAVVDAAATSNSGAFDLQARTQAHFAACTSLLRAYYRREPELTPPLGCTVVDIRPEHTDYDCGPEAASELTAGPVRRATVPGTHWTMLFEQNVLVVAKVVQEYLL